MERSTEVHPRAVEVDWIAPRCWTYRTAVRREDHDRPGSTILTHPIANRPCGVTARNAVRAAGTAGRALP